MRGELAQITYMACFMCCHAYTCEETPRARARSGGHPKVDFSQDTEECSNGSLDTAVNAPFPELVEPHYKCLCARSVQELYITVHVSGGDFNTDSRSAFVALFTSPVKAGIQRNKHLNISCLLIPVAFPLKKMIIADD